MMLVRHAMTARPVTASPDMNAEDAAGLMLANDIGVVPVTDGDRLVGVVTDRDLVLRVIAARQDPRSVRPARLHRSAGWKNLRCDRAGRKIGRAHV